MTVEVDFSAWEKWQQDHHHEDEAINTYVKSNLYQFCLHGTTWRAKNACLVVLIYYYRRKHGPGRDDFPAEHSTYDFLAEDEKTPIRKMLRTRWMQQTKTVVIEAYDINEKTAEKLHQLFTSLPEPTYGSNEFRLETDVHFAYHIRLPCYGNKIFDWGHDYYNFLPVEDPHAFNATLVQIMAICDAHS